MQSDQISNKHRDKAAMHGQRTPAYHRHLARSECHPLDLLRRKSLKAGEIFVASALDVRFWESPVSTLKFHKRLLERELEI